MRKFYVVSGDEIEEGKVVDVYFLRTMRILKAKDLASKKVVMEVSARSLPNEEWSWGVLAGVEEVVQLLTGRNVDLYSLRDGDIFMPGMPVMKIEGPYDEFGALETTILGFLCSLSGVATAAAKVKLAAGGKPVVNFGIRRSHPAVSLAFERASLIGGLDGSSGILLEELGINPLGTMPHAMIILFNDPAEAWKAYDEVLPPEIPRVALVDTFYDEKTESLMAAKTLGERLDGVRLDTPFSRRGDFEKIVREVRWELDIRGYKHVKIFVSGGLNEKSVMRLSKAGADAFGVGTYITGARPIDFGMDIVEVEGGPVAKRGVMAGSKDVYVCEDHLTYKVVLTGNSPPRCNVCGKEMVLAYRKFLEGGRLVHKPDDLESARKRVKEVLKKLSCMGRMF